MAIGDRIKKYRLSLGISQVSLADKAAISKQTLYKYENGIITNIPTDKIEVIASALNTTPADLMGWTDDHAMPRTKAVRIPVLGRVAAGIPINAIEEILDWEEIPEKMARQGEFFGLQIKGDSMSPRIMNGDVVIVRKQDDADTGDIVIAIINGDDGCCKKLKKTGNEIVLISLNPAYSPMVFTETESDTIPVRIIGKVVELRGKF